MEKEDAELIQDYLSGDILAFEHLISRYLKSVYNFVYRLCGNAEEAQDITQEVFLKIWKNIKKYDSQKRFKAWLFTIARNTTFDWLRKKKHLVFSDLDSENGDISFESTIRDTEPLPDAIFEKNELGGLLEGALESIPLNYKSVILLRHNENLTFEEIATMTEKPMNTIKSQYRRGLLLLQEYFKNAPK